MGVHVYIDGFNFYHRLFKNRGRHHPIPPRFKWLDLLKLSQELMPGETIDWIGYFTAYVRPRPSDPDQPKRQRAYLEALKTIPCLEIVPGQFLEVQKRGVPIAGPPNTVVTFRTFEEKGSDVNLACRLVFDGARSRFSQALVFTYYGDLREPIRLVAQDLHLPVAVISPDLTVNGTLRKVATSAQPLDVTCLKRCLFPDNLANASGVPISKPSSWT